MHSPNSSIWCKPINVFCGHLKRKEKKYSILASLLYNTSSRTPGISWQSKKAPSAVKADHAARLGERHKPQMVNSVVLCNTWKTQEYVWSECSPAPAVGQGNTPASAQSHRCLTSCFPIIWNNFCPSCSHYSVHYVQHYHSALLIRKPLICFKTSSTNNFLWKSTEILPQITPQCHLSNRVTTLSWMPLRHYSAFFKNC